MLYCLITQPKSNTLVNSADLAVRCIHSNDNDSYDVIVRMPEKNGNVFIRSLGSLRESDVKDAYGADFSPVACKHDSNYDVYAWTDKLALRPTTLGKYALCAEHDKVVQAMVVISGPDHRIEINRKRLREGEGGCGYFSVLRMMIGDLACIDGNWLAFDNGLQRLKTPLNYPLKMVDYTSEFNKGKIIGPDISFF